MCTPFHNQEGQPYNYELTYHDNHLLWKQLPTPNVAHAKPLETPFVDPTAAAWVPADSSGKKTDKSKPGKKGQKKEEEDAGFDSDNAEWMTLRKKGTEAMPIEKSGDYVQTTMEVCFGFTHLQDCFMDDLQGG